MKSIRCTEVADCLVCEIARGRKHSRSCVEAKGATAMLAMLLDDNTAFIVSRFMTYETQVSELVGERSEVLGFVQNTVATMSFAHRIE